MKYLKYAVFALICGFSANIFAQKLDQIVFNSCPLLESQSKVGGVFLISSKSDQHYEILLGFMKEDGSINPNKSVKLEAHLVDQKSTNVFWNGLDNEGNAVASGVQIVVNISQTSKSQSPTNLNEKMVISYGLDLDRDNDDVSLVLDGDADNDGIPMQLEYEGFYPYSDADKDKIPNYLDVDFLAGGAAFEDRNRDGIADFFDVDLDGLMNDEDRDANQDGVLDVFHVAVTDANDNGEFDGFYDENDNGMDDSLELLEISLADADKDGIADVFDADADNDGVINNIECQDVMNYKPISGYDINRNGVLDIYDHYYGGESLRGLDLDKNGTIDMYEFNTDGISFNDQGCNAEYKIRTSNLFKNCESSVTQKNCLELAVENVQDPNEKEVILQWDMGDGNKLEGRSIKHCYKEQGNYAVILNVLDASDRTLIQSDEIQREIVTANNISTSLDFPAVAKLGANVKIDFGLSMPTGYRLKEVIWDFGDGEFSCELSPDHIFKDVGEFEVGAYFTIESNTSKFYLCKFKSITVNK